MPSELTEDGGRRASFRLAAVAALLLALVAFGSLAEEMTRWEPLVSLDHRIDAELNERATPWVTSVMEAVSWLGSTPALMLVALAVGGAALVRRRPRAAALVVLAFVGAEALDGLLKVEFARPRPSLAHPVVPQAGGYSFPSGHATGSLAVYGALAYLALATAPSRAIRVAFVAGALVLVGAIGFSRLYLGEHFPSDVIGGWCLALAWLALLVLVLFASPNRRSRADRTRPAADELLSEPLPPAKVRGGGSEPSTNQGGADARDHRRGGGGTE